MKNTASMRLGEAAVDVERGDTRVEIVTIRPTPAAAARGEDGRQPADEVRKVEVAMAVDEPVARPTVRHLALPADHAASGST